MPRGDITLHDCRIIYRNFSGSPGRFNEKGDRNFCVILEEDLARKLEKDGFNVKWKQPRVEGDPVMPILKVNVRYWARDGRRLRPPRVVLITSRGKTHLEERDLQALDWSVITKVDMILNPYEREPGKRTAYLGAIYVTIQEDELELQYADIPDTALAAVYRTGSLDESREGDPPF